MSVQVILKLIVALLLGGAIGYEREHLSRPAGLRTHAIVCIGATLIQIVSIGFQSRNQGLGSYDPFRLGAQVISGIGFLGAGTIIKEGVSVKGLTTAASIWTVACIGLAVGSGLYGEAVFTAIFLMIALKGLKQVENLLLNNKKAILLEIVAQNTEEKLEEISGVLEQISVSILSISVDYSNAQFLQIGFLLGCGKTATMPDILRELSHVSGIKDARFKSAVGY